MVSGGIAVDQAIDILVLYGTGEGRGEIVGPIHQRGRARPAFRAAQGQRHAFIRREERIAHKARVGVPVDVVQHQQAGFAQGAQRLLGKGAQFFARRGLQKGVASFAQGKWPARQAAYQRAWQIYVAEFT